MWQGNTFLAAISDEELFKELRFRVKNNLIDLDKMKRGIKCVCDREMKAYGYELNDTMAILASRLYSYCNSSGQKEFLMTDACGPEVEHRTEVYKLKPLGIIKRVGEKWKFTNEGISWVLDETALSTKVWVFNDNVVYKEPYQKKISEVLPNHKDYQDWIKDFAPMNYQEVNYQEVLI